MSSRGEVEKGKAAKIREKPPDSEIKRMLKIRHRK
jgi:hypothetical protein